MWSSLVLILVIVPFLVAAPVLPLNDGGKFVIPSHHNQVPEGFQHIQYNFGQTEIILSGEDKLSGYLSIPINENHAFIQFSYPHGAISNRLHSQNISFYSPKSNVIFRWNLEENVYNGHSLPNSYCAYEIDKIAPECGFWGQSGDKNAAKLTFRKDGNVSFGIHSLNFSVPQVFDHYVYTFVPFFLSWNHPDVNFTLTLSEETKLAFHVHQYGYEPLTSPVTATATEEPQTSSLPTQIPKTTKVVTEKLQPLSQDSEMAKELLENDDDFILPDFFENGTIGYDGSSGIVWRIEKP